MRDGTGRERMGLAWHWGWDGEMRDQGAWDGGGLGKDVIRGTREG